MEKTCKFCKSKIDAEAIKCPKCGTDQRSWFARHPILTFFCLIFISCFMITISLMSPDQQKTTKTSNDPVSETISEEYKTSLAESFCTNRSNGKKYFDLEPIAKYLSGEDDGSKSISNTTQKPSSDNCKKVAEWCLSTWNKEECEDMANKKIWIGMNELQLEISWGNPNDKNNTTGSWGTHSQWVYGDPIYGANYVYLEGKNEDSMIVTSWQN